jgi:phosphatidate phosphatase APP1
MIQRVLYELDRRVGRGYRRARAGLGLANPPRIVPYRGWGFGEQATLLARVLEDRGAPPFAEGAPLAQTFMAAYRRYATVEIPEVELRVRWASQSFSATTDDEGHILSAVTIPGEAAPGWNDIELELKDGAARAKGEVLITPATASLAIVSDIDDTVIDTNVRHPLARAAALFLTDSRVRLPFAGIAAFYRALSRGDRPTFYVSSSPWNLYEHLCVLFERHDLPKGPVLLRDWGISRTHIAPGWGHAHKVEKVNALVVGHPGVSFVLIGDTSQEDAQHYVAIAEHHPGRVRAIYIRDVGGTHERQLEAYARRARDHGTELVVVEDSVAAARHAASIGLISHEDIASVAADRRADEAMPSPIEQVLAIDGAAS